MYCGAYAGWIVEVRYHVYRVCVDHIGVVFWRYVDDAVATVWPVQMWNLGGWPCGVAAHDVRICEGEDA